MSKRDAWDVLFNKAIAKSGIASELESPLRPKYRRDDAEAYDFLTKLAKFPRKFIDDGHSLVIYSDNVGNGKTLWAKTILQTVIAELCTDFDLTVPPGKFVRYAQLAFELSSFSSFENDRDKFAEIEELATVPLLVIDDLGTGAITKTGYPLLYNLIDMRLSSGRPTIYTTNLAEEEIARILGDRLASRIYDNANVIEFVAGGVRGKDEEDIE